MSGKFTSNPKSRIRLLVPLAAVILTFAVMAIFFWNFFYRVIVQPLYNLYVLMYYAVNSIPQGIYHLIIIAACFFIAAWAIANAYAKSRTSLTAVSDDIEGEALDVESRYQFWRLETHNIKYSKFARDDFSRNARRLILQIIAHQEHLPYEEVEDLAESGMLNLPAPISDLIRTRSLDLKHKPDQQRMPLVRQLFWSLGLIRQGSDPFIDEKVNAIIDFIEQRLEIVHYE